MDSLGDLTSWQSRYTLLAVIGERSARTGCQFKQDMEKRIVTFTGLTRIAERPTGAGLPLRMGLRDINGKAGR